LVWATLSVTGLSSALARRRRADSGAVPTIAEGQNERIPAHAGIGMSGQRLDRDERHIHLALANTDPENLIEARRECADIHGSPPSLPSVITARSCICQQWYID